MTQGGKHTEFSNVISLDIGYHEIMDKISFKDEIQYVDKNGNIFPSSAAYTYSKVSKDNLVQILGEDGYINVYDSNNKLITTLNKDNLEYKYEGITAGLSFETSKPVEEGILKLENGRSILPLEYSKVQEESFANIKVNIKGNIIKDDQTIISSNGEKTIELKDAMSKAELELSNSNLSTIVKNDGVGMRITLDTNDMSTKLYKNPEINITFPSYVSNVKVENVKLVYEKELKIESAKLYKNDAGNIEIGIKLQGEQTAYNEEYNADGAMLVMNADITTDKLTPAKADNIHLKVKNENADETVENNAEVKFVAPAGIAAISEVSGYSDKEQNAISINGTKEIGKIEENASAKEATMKIIAMNNYDYSCNNIVILGRTPFAGNKSIEGQKDLGSTFDAKMIGEIASENADLSNMTVYYSANKTANKNLEDRQNGWTTNRNEVENVASYMIVLNDFEFKAGEMLTFTYKIQIPENISKNQQTFGTFGVYYETTMGDDVVRTISLPTTYVEGTPVGIATEVGVELKVTLQSNLEEGHSIQVGENITYTAKVENLSSIKAENVKLKIYMSKNTVFVKTDGTHDGGGINRTIILDVGDIEGNSSKNVVFTLNVTSYDTSEDEQMEALIKSYEEEQEKIKEEEERIAKEEEEKGYSEEQKQAAAKAREEAKWGKPGDDNYEELQQQKKEYEETQKNIKKYIEEYKNRNKITTKVTVYTEADANTEYGSDGSVGEGDVGQSGNQNSQNVNPNPSQGSSIADLRLNLSTMQDGILSEGQDVICTLRVTQNTTKELSNVKLTCVIPEGLTFKKASNAEKYDYNPDTRTVTYTFDKMVGAKTMTLICSVDKLPAGSYEKQYDIAFSGTYDGLDRDPYQSNVISMTAYRDGFSISQNSSVSSGVLYEGDKITYNIIVNNLTSKDTIATVYDVLPNELQFEEGYYTQDEVQRGITSAGANNIRTDLVLKANEQLILHIVAKVKEVNNTPVKITNKVYLTSTDIERLDANDISHTIYKKGDVVDPNNPNNPNDPNNPNGQGGDEKNGYTISGVAWIDEDKDGLREDNEQLLENIKVYLLNSRTNAVISETQTNKNGVYEFKGVKNGSYVVAFDYDNNQYEVTVYQAENAGDSVNSDAIKMELTIKGNSKEYALTNTLVINDNQYNIDLGLTYNRKFELSVNKGISLVQLTNANGTKNYNFNDGDAKIEIPEKYIDSSTIAITYKITIKNTGTIPGYVGKVVDYKARDLDFNSALNPEWYEDSNGNLYNTSLAGRVINPGETVELSIILTKTVNGENIGISNNTAEIAEASNDYGIPLSTTPGNKNGTEADLGSCDIIVAVQSGGIIFYGGILLLVLAIFALRWIYNK